MNVFMGRVSISCMVARYGNGPFGPYRGFSSVQHGLGSISISVLQQRLGASEAHFSHALAFLATFNRVILKIEAKFSQVHVLNCQKEFFSGFLLPSKLLLAIEK